MPTSDFSWADRIPLPERHKATWAREVEGGSLGSRMTAAVRLVAAGLPVRAAATAVGYASHQDVQRTAAALGFTRHDRASIARGMAEVAGLSMEEWKRRLEEDPGKIPMNQLQIGAGIATDKVAKAEGWESRLQGSSGRIEDFHRELAKAFEGKKLTLTVEEVPGAIDLISQEPCAQPE